MKKQIWKYKVPEHAPYFEIEMPKGSEVLTVQTQKGMPVIWALVTDLELEVRKFKFTTTGYESEYPENTRYIGTFQLMNGVLVYHVFEVYE